VSRRVEITLWSSGIVSSFIFALILLGHRP